MPPEIRRGAGPTLLVFQALGRRRGNWLTLTARSCLKMKTIFRKKSLTAAGCKTRAGSLAEAQECVGGGQRETEGRTRAFTGPVLACQWRVLVGKGSCA